MKDKNKCENKFCRNNFDITYLGKRLCQECFDKKCDEDDTN